eukprot:CAMPEP_0201513436 /NCGR_PEP_ID=MMETSP0161_2-20130828/5485_1 /ASSEMBLY_ACC=CAM_ASM_000251 /TAXON_ID=180227 /ORGANISM="Neoparamoeba aestuarina, Strain SoJaBio B1-5/56/2" /LENGTH=84 /DNA_ID=CAMNT_0047909639 /DNA_START=62 /DNA_END=316 /DNA_ORIENTATION=+
MYEVIYTGSVIVALLTGAGLGVQALNNLRNRPRPTGRTEYYRAMLTRDIYVQRRNLAKQLEEEGNRKPTLIERMRHAYSAGKYF